MPTRFSRPTGFHLRRFRLSLIFTAGLLATAASGRPHSRPIPGVLEGTVINLQGSPVGAAEVFLQGSDGTSPHILHTDSQGEFRMPSLRAGLYDLRAESAGMWSEWEHNVMLRPGGHATVTLRLLRMTPPATPPRATPSHANPAAHATTPGMASPDAEPLPNAK